jgi:hypothetical protein
MVTKFRALQILYVMLEAPAWSRGLENFVSYLILFREGLVLLKLAGLVSNLINTSPCYLKYVTNQHTQD